MCSIRRYRLDADSPCAMRDHGQKDRRRQLEKAVSQGNKAVVKVTLLAIRFYSPASGEHTALIVNQLGSILVVLVPLLGEHRMKQISSASYIFLRHPSIHEARLHANERAVVSSLNF